jgi:hypothetical protein
MQLISRVLAMQRVRISLALAVAWSPVTTHHRFVRPTARNAAAVGATFSPPGLGHENVDMGGIDSIAPKYS